MRKRIEKFGSVLALSLTVSVMPVAAITGTPAFAKQPAAAASLGNLASFQTIVADTLAAVNKGDLKAARTRIKDLETAWDKAETTLKPKNKATWTYIDTAIDEALAALRQPNPQATDAAVALSKLDATLKEYSI
ncbi:hypothetical protein GCM10007874_72850 [Labrys miyagiensis]|uniref:Histidine kinase n=1 Tax=Labrys miyagiensis TaxID=346912 RepID=A0ABQ6CVY1_9HYPH|nr:hypothetical protein [Labrys miyagiensis]GLS24264.1 hypothetical protein GCM10007874_72850 [Labrys miyagiensis]